METEGKIIKLTSTEITAIWTAYMNDSGLICQLQYFLAKAEDEEISPLIQQVLDQAQGNIKSLTEIFIKEKFPIPYGFKLDEDVDISAPRLYSDIYVLHYLHFAARIALQAYTISLSLVVRPDVYSHFNKCISEWTTFLRRVKDLLLSKGLYMRSPYLPIPDKIDFVKDQSFLTGYFGEKRPLISLEISNLFANFERNALGIATLIGYSQVAKSKEVRQFLVRGKEIASKHCDIFGTIMKENDLPIPMLLNTEVTDLTAYTFSDKLMMFYTTALIALSVGYYGASMGGSPRRDLGVQYGRLTVEILKYAEDGAQIMIKNGWLEEPPKGLDRDELAKKNS